jgi:hypothetical protein
MMLFTEQASVAEIDDLQLEDDDHERRRGLRVRDKRPVKVFEPWAARYFGGQTEDISATGLRIELPLWAPVREGETLNIHVGLNRRGESLANRRNMIPARVVWVNRTPGKRARLEVGVEFLNTIGAHLGAA